MPVHVRPEGLILVRLYTFFVETEKTVRILGPQNQAEMMLTAIDGILVRFEYSSKSACAAALRVSAGNLKPDSFRRAYLLSTI